MFVISRKKKKLFFFLYKEKKSKKAFSIDNNLIRNNLKSYFAFPERIINCKGNLNFQTQNLQDLEFA